MLLVVGLGNPGREHEGQRHNAGFMAVETLRQADGLPELQAKFHGLWSRGTLGGVPAALLQPQTYMNLSGESVQPASAFLKVAPADVIVVHDELDLPWRDVRIKMGGGHAGHNGLRSIIQHLGTPEFARVRIGIGKPPAVFGGTIADWVLSRFDPVERAELADVLERAADAVRSIAKDGVTLAISRQGTKGPKP